jgi:hypothetical protein
LEECGELTVGAAILLVLDELEEVELRRSILDRERERERER